MRPQGLAPKQGLVNLQTGAPTFLCDGTVGALARLLKILGFDVIFSDDHNANHLIRESNISKRILITTSHEIAERPLARRVIRVPDKKKSRQLACINRSLQLKSWISPFTRCIRCNKALMEIPKDRVRELVPPYVWDTHAVFRFCPECGRVYWAGSHRDMMKEKLLRGPLGGFTPKGRSH